MSKSCIEAETPEPAAGRRPTADPTADPRLVARELHSLESRVQAIARGHDELDQRIDDIASQTPDDSATVSVEPEYQPPPPGLDEDARLAALSDTIERSSQILGDHFNADPTDETWSRATEAEIGQFLADDAYTGVALDAVECRSTVCRVEMTFADQDALQAFISTASREHPWKYSAQMFPHDARDPLAVNLYIAREGHDLPPL